MSIMIEISIHGEMAINNATMYDVQFMINQTVTSNNKTYFSYIHL